MRIVIDPLWFWDTKTFTTNKVPLKYSLLHHDKITHEDPQTIINYQL